MWFPRAPGTSTEVRLWLKSGTIYPNAKPSEINLMTDVRIKMLDSAIVRLLFTWP